MAQHITVCEYNPKWEEAYKMEAALISEILGKNLKEIHHIGSTAVKGLKAKPIIDIMPVVFSIENVDMLNAEFQKIGYECMGEFGIQGRRYFRKGGDERTHQIHIFEEGNKKDIYRHLAVRDYLRSHKDLADEYGDLKVKLAEKYPYDIEGYCDGKELFVRELEKKAVKWRQALT